MPWNSAGTAGKGEAASGVKGGAAAAGNEWRPRQRLPAAPRGKEELIWLLFNSEVLRECSRTRSGFGEGLLGIGARLPPRCHGNVRVELQPDRDVRTPELPLQPLPGSASPLGSKVLVEPFDPHFGFLFNFFF